MGRSTTKGDEIESPRATATVSRRSVVATIGVVATAGLAGCSAVLDRLGDMVLEDVNVFNETDQQLSGSIEIVDPGGDVALEETFELAASGEGEENEDEEAIATYDDVWGAAGEYDVRVELDEGLEVRGESSAEKTVQIDDPDEDMVAVALGAEDLEDGISVLVGDSISDFELESA